jgi:uncharacterized membrane protein YjgN (DUF898 family)
MTQQPPPAYGDYRPPAPNHPQSTTVLILGILGIVVCGLCGPFAWSMGNRVVAEIDRSGGQVGGRTEANVGRILGIVATVLLVVSILFLVLFLGLAASFTTS